VAGAIPPFLRTHALLRAQGPAQPNPRAPAPLDSTARPVATERLGPCHDEVDRAGGERAAHADRAPVPPARHRVERARARARARADERVEQVVQPVFARPALAPSKVSFLLALLLLVVVVERPGRGGRRKGLGGRGEEGERGRGGGVGRRRAERAVARPPRTRVGKRASVGERRGVGEGGESGGRRGERRRRRRRGRPRGDEVGRDPHLDRAAAARRGADDRPADDRPAVVAERDEREVGRLVGTRACEYTRDARRGWGQGGGRDARASRSPGARGGG
jgi:hypothetical protein